jgi:hypothetical protein
VNLLADDENLAAERAKKRDVVAFPIFLGASSVWVEVLARHIGRVTAQLGRGPTKIGVGQRPGETARRANGSSKLNHGEADGVEDLLQQWNTVLVAVHNVWLMPGLHPPAVSPPCPRWQRSEPRPLQTVCLDSARPADTSRVGRCRKALCPPRQCVLLGRICGQ